MLKKIFKKDSSITVAGIIVFSNRGILLQKRSGVTYRGFWGLPGGHVEPDESIKDALIREVKEEVGLEVTIVKKLGVYHEKGRSRGVRYDYMANCFLAKPISGKIQPQLEEVSEARIFGFKEIPKRLAFRHSDMVRDFLNGK